MALFSNSTEFQKLAADEQYKFKTWKKIYMNTFKRSEEEAEEGAIKELIKMKKLSRIPGIIRY